MITVSNEELDDQILIKSDGFPTYNFANVVDDHLMKITHVVRGNEYLSSTPKYNLLYESFGWDIPVYVHLPLILRPTGQKLSKRAGDPSFEDLISNGYLPEAVVNYVALLGWSPGTTQEIFTLEELEQCFTIEGISKAPAVFDIKKLNWMNGEYIRKMPLEEFNRLAIPYYKKVISKENIDFMKISKLLQVRTEVLSTIPESIDFIERLPEYDASLYINKKMKTDIDMSLSSLKAALPILENLQNWDETGLHDSLIKLANEMGIKSGQMFWPIRVAITGKEVTPGGAVEIASILGKDETIKRIKFGIEKLLKEEQFK
jgi:glutamyl-tRNA synthetase